MFKIDTFSPDDHDKVVRYMTEHGVEVAERDRGKMFVVAKLPKGLGDRMRIETLFEREVLITRA